MGRGKGNAMVLLPSVFVLPRVEELIRSLMRKHNISKSDAIRLLLDNGILYMAMYGDDPK